MDNCLWAFPFSKPHLEGISDHDSPRQFPRVSVNLDEYSLELTPQCAEALKGVDDKASLTEFFGTFGRTSRMGFCSGVQLDLHTYTMGLGEFFTTKVQLGGRLHASEELTTADAANMQEAKQSMRAGASASFNPSRNTGSVTVKSDSGSSGENGEYYRSLARPISWEASGGDPLLCNKYVTHVNQFTLITPVLLSRKVGGG